MFPYLHVFVCLYISSSAYAAFKVDIPIERKRLEKEILMRVHDKLHNPSTNTVIVAS